MTNKKILIKKIIKTKYSHRSLFPVEDFLLNETKTQNIFISPKINQYQRTTIDYQEVCVSLAISIKL